MTTHTTDYVRNIMTLAARPEGVSPAEVGGSVGDVTKTCMRIAKLGFGTWIRTGFRASRMWVTPEQYTAWLATKTPKAKDPRRVAAGLKGRQLKAPTKPSGAQWDRSGPAFITSETKVTIWKERTRAEWIADVVAA